MNIAHIIGNGDSILHNAPETPDASTIVINGGYRARPNAAYMLFSDDDFYLTHKDSNPEKDFWRFTGEIFSDCALVGKHPRIQPLTDEMLALKAGKKKFTAKGKNTGLKAICFAFNMGFDRVVLHGFDGRPNANNYPAQAVYDLYAQHHTELAALGLPIVNLTPDSALTMYSMEF